MENLKFLFTQKQTCKMYLSFPWKIFPTDVSGRARSLTKIKKGHNSQLPIYLFHLNGRRFYRFARIRTQCRALLWSKFWSRHDRWQKYWPGKIQLCSWQLQPVKLVRLKVKQKLDVWRENLPGTTFCLPNWKLGERSPEVPFAPVTWPLISTREEYAFGFGVIIIVFSEFHLIVGGNTTSGLSLALKIW